jgi:hypothetical protein
MGRINNAMGSANVGTTAHQVTQNEAVRARLGIPANATPLVNGAESNLPLMEGRPHLLHLRAFEEGIV